MELLASERKRSWNKAEASGRRDMFTATGQGHLGSRTEMEEVEQSPAHRALC